MRFGKTRTKLDCVAAVLRKLIGAELVFKAGQTLCRDLVLSSKLRIDFMARAEQFIFVSLASGAYLSGAHSSPVKGT